MSPKIGKGVIHVLADLRYCKSAAEIARLNGVSEQTVRNRKEELRAVRVGWQWLIDYRHAAKVFAECPDRRQRPRRRRRVDAAA